MYMPAFLHWNCLREGYSLSWYLYIYIIVIIIYSKPFIIVCMYSHMGSSRYSILLLFWIRCYCPGEWQVGEGFNWRECMELLFYYRKRQQFFTRYVKRATTQRRRIYLGKYFEGVDQLLRYISTWKREEVLILLISSLSPFSSCGLV